MNMHVIRNQSRMHAGRRYEPRESYASGNLRCIRPWLVESKPKADVREAQLNPRALPNGGK